MDIRIESLVGDGFTAAIPALSDLRCRVFRDWPYLYTGDPEYERNYLASFAASGKATIVAAFDGETIVGAATAAPLESHTSEFAPLFAKFAMQPARVFYFGESVLLPTYRGLGIGHAFFDHREAAARAATTSEGHAFEIAAFCGVIRQEGDPRQPAGYRPLDPFWRKRGFEPVAGMIGEYRWTEFGETQETAKPMQFWAKKL